MKIDITTIKRSQEYNELVRFYKSSLLWKAGEYSAVAKIHVVDTNETIEHCFNFSLSELEIDTLNKNIEFAISVIDYEFITPDQQLNGAWIWVNSSIN